MDATKGELWSISPRAMLLLPSSPPKIGPRADIPSAENQINFFESKLMLDVALPFMRRNCKVRIV